MTPIVGIPACSKAIDQMPQYATPVPYVEAVMAAVGAVPVLIPPIGEAALTLLDRLDGLLLTGSHSNIEPWHYGVAASATPGRHDPARDTTVLPLIRATVGRGLPLLGLCRGLQELNVALGGTLHQELHTLPERMDHRGDSSDPELRYRPRHPVTLTGTLARIIGRERITVNSSHGQAIDRLATGLAVEAAAPDGTIEGVRLVTSGSFVLAVQWHPEWHFAENAASQALFAAFGEACRSWIADTRRAA